MNTSHTRNTLNDNPAASMGCSLLAAFLAALIALIPPAAADADEDDDRCRRPEAARLMAGNSGDAGQRDGDSDSESDSDSDSDSDSEYRSNVYLGLGDEGGIDNSRRAWCNEDITARRIRRNGVELDWRFDVTSVFPGLEPDNPVFSRIVGPLATPQADKDTVYFNVGAGWTRSAGVTPEALTQSKIVALDREDGQVKWVADYDTLADQSLLMLADKYPHEYSRAEIEAYLAGGGRAASGFIGSFAPIAVFGDYIVTGDSTQSSEALAYGYLAGAVAQAEVPAEYAGKNDYQGRPYISPLLGKQWGMRDDNPWGDANARRHLLRNAIMLLDKHTGELLAVDRYADSGEEAADGYVNVGAALRMATPYYDPEDGGYSIIAGCSGTTAFFPYTGIDLDRGRIDIGIANGNIRTAKGGRVTRFRVEKTADGVALTEDWRFYPSPPMLEAGDRNPFTGEVFETTSQAEEYNYGFDGVWAQRPIVDLERRQTCFATGNGKQMPVEDIRLGRSASIARSENSHPEWTWQQWVRHFNEAADRTTGSAEAQAAAFADYRVTQADTHRALSTVSSERPAEAVDRYKQYLANSISCIGLDDGEFRWTWRRTPLDTWNAQGALILRSACGPQPDPECVNDLYPEFLRWQSVGNGGDIDFGQGPVHIRDGDDDLYIALGKDGSMQGLDPDSGAVQWYTQVSHPHVLGGMNYGATTDGESVYVNLLNFKRSDGAATLLAEGIIDENDQPKIRLHPAGLAGSFNQDGWYTDSFFDTFNDLGGGPSKHYRNADVLIPSGTNFLARVDVHNGRVRGNAPTNPFIQVDTFAEIRAVGEGLNNPITSVGDVILAPGGSGSGKFYAFSAKNFGLLWEYDARADTADIVPDGIDPQSRQPYHTGTVAPIVPAGRDLFVGAGETGFLGNFPGKYFYKFSVGASK